MEINKILKWVIWGGIFALPLIIPFIITQSLFFPFITGKGFVFRIIIEVILATYIVLALRDPAYRPKFSWILVGLTGFIFVIFLADLFAENPFKAFWSNYERMEGFISLAHLFVYFLVAGAMLNTEKIWINFFRVSVAASVVMSAYGFLQLAGKFVINQGGVRLDGTLGNATYLAGYMLFNFFLAAFLLAREKRMWLKILYGLAMVLQVVIMYYTATRGAFLGLIGGSFLTLAIIAIFAKTEPVLRKISVGILAAILVLAGVFFMVKDSKFVASSPMFSRLAAISTKTDDAQARFMIWNMALKGFKEHPVLGWGQEGFNYVFNRYYNPKMYTREQWFDRTHNIVFDWLIAGGILGLFFYLLVLFGALFYIIGYLPGFLKRFLGFSGVDLSLTEKAVLVGLLASYFTQNFFVFDNVVSYILFFSLLAYLHNLRGVPISALDAKRFRPDENEVFQFGGPIVLVALVFAVYFLNARPILAATNLIEAIKPHPKGAIENFDYFKKTLSYNTLGNQEAREQLVQAASTVVRSSAAEDLKSSYVSLVKSEMEKQLKQSPNDTRAHVFLGSFLSLSGDGLGAIKEYETAYKLSPRKQTIAFALASEEVNNGMAGKAVEVMKETFEGAPEYNDVRLVYAAVAIYAGNNKLAEDLLVPIYGTALVPDSKIIQAYFSTKQFSKVFTILKEELKKAPNDPQLHTSLAAVYLATEDRTKAISEIQTAIKLKPDFKAQGEYIIQQIREGKNP